MLIVLSMHRSGSSLLTGLLAQNGFYTGDIGSHVEVNDNNPKGFWELKKVVAINEEIIKTNVNNHLVPSPKQESPIEDVTRNEISLFASELNEGNIDLLKDPRFCLTLHHWLPYLDDVKVIVLFRHPQDVACSLEKRQNFPLSAGKALWEFYNLKALNQTRLLPRKFVNFNDLVDSTDIVIKSIKNWYFESQQTGAKNNEIMSSEFFDSTLVHNNTRSDEPLALTDNQSQLYKALVASNISDSYFDIPASCQESLLMLEEFVAKGYMPGSGRLVDDKAKQDIQILTQRVEVLNQRVEVLNQRVEVLNQEVSKLNRKINSLNQALEQLRIFHDLSRDFLESRVGRLLASYEGFKGHIKREDRRGYLKNLESQLKKKIPS